VMPCDLEDETGWFTMGCACGVLSSCCYCGCGGVGVGTGHRMVLFVGVAVVVVVVVLLLCCLSARGGSALAPSERATRTTLYLLRDTSSYTSYRLACRYVRCKTKSPTPRTELRACSVSPS